MGSVASRGANSQIRPELRLMRVKATPRLQTNDGGYGADSGPSRRDPCRRALRPLHRFPTASANACFGRYLPRSGPRPGRSRLEFKPELRKLTSAATVRPEQTPDLFREFKHVAYNGVRDVIGWTSSQSWTRTEASHVPGEG